MSAEFWMEKNIRNKAGKIGTVVRTEGEYIYVKFPEEDEKVFGFPSAIEKGYLTFCDEEAQKRALEAAEREREGRPHHAWMDKKPDETTPAIRSVSGPVFEQTAETWQVELPKPAENFLRENYVQEEEDLGTVEQIIKYLKDERGVKYLVHFTPIENLESILKHGITSRNSKKLSKEERAARIYPDEKEYGKELFWEWPCFSLTRPNSLILDTKRMNKGPEIMDYVVLYLTVDALQEANGVEELLFYDTNALWFTNRSMPEPRGLECAKKMFADAVLVKKGFISRQDRGIEDRRDWPTSVQAEIKVGFDVDPKFIKKIVVPREWATRVKGICAKARKDIPVEAVLQKDLPNRRPDVAYDKAN